MATACLSFVLLQGTHPLGAQPLLLGALLPLAPTDDTSTTQCASVLCQEQLSPPNSVRHARGLCSGSGRRVSGGIRRWSLRRGCGRCSENKAWQQQAQDSHHVPSWDPTTSTPMAAELLAGCLLQPQPLRWPRQLLRSCSHTPAASKGVLQLRPGSEMLVRAGCGGSRQGPSQPVLYSTEFEGLIHRQL